MNATSLTDTSATVHERLRALIGSLAPAERLGRAVTLSALAREFAWAGARRVAGDRGPDAVRQRFLEQAYGAGTADWVARRISAERGS